jgi:rhodanese-related sulfurtransferase
MDQVEFYEAKLMYETDAWDLFESVKNKKDMVIVDTRSKEAYDIEHIPSAINLPHREMTVESMKNFDKTKTYVVYCDGIGCNASTKGALKLSRFGFKVKELLGGLDWWKRDGYATEGKKCIRETGMSCGCA